MVNTKIQVQTLKDLCTIQIDFQDYLVNDIPKGIVTFDNVQTALAHNIYQTIEFQEFMESNSQEDREKELMDYLLFMINKYIFLGAFLGDKNLGVRKVSEYLFSNSSKQSFSQCTSLEHLEQDNFITFIRSNCIFKPWKVKSSDNCSNIELANKAFYISLSYFKQMAEIVFSDYNSFCSTLLDTFEKNITRQKNGY